MYYSAADGDTGKPRRIELWDLCRY